MGNELPMLPLDGGYGMTYGPDRVGDQVGILQSIYRLGGGFDSIVYIVGTGSRTSRE